MNDSMDLLSEITQEEYFIVEYIWIDGGSPTQTLRAKTRVIPSTGGPLELYKGEEFLGSAGEYDWSFDGSSTMQAEGGKSDCLLKPVEAFRDPTRKRVVDPVTGVPVFTPLLFLCEVFNADGTPHASNRRAKLRELIKELNRKGKKPEASWFGFEQEYTLFKGSRPLGFGDDRRFPAAQGPYYCGVGADEVFGREMVEDHLLACTQAGINLTGINAEVMPGQWEFQVGGPDYNALRASDHLWVARWLLYRVGENYGIHATLDPKPVPGDWNGAGMHTNFSTPEMRTTEIEGFHSMGPGPFGIDAIEAWCKSASNRISEHLSEYGDGIETRLTGKHETCSYREFRWGISDRTASIRIPLAAASKGCGYLEDRRPNANACPYRVARVMLETAYEPITAAVTDSEEAPIEHRLPQEWMRNDSSFNVGCSVCGAKPGWQCSGGGLHAGRIESKGPWQLSLFPD